MTIKESIEQIESLVEAWDLDEADLNQTDINAIKCLLNNRQELIEYLKEEIEILENVPKDEELTIEATGRLNAYRIILLKIEKSDK